MIDPNERINREQEKDRVRQRMQVRIDPDNYEYIPAKKQADYYDNDIKQRVGIYVRVSTTDIRQTTSYELQKKYYEDFVVRHPNWTLVKIYADEGISGTSLKHRDQFNQMIADARAGKLDMIITKSVSRFARNVMICIGMVRELAELKPPVGVFFESECIFSLNDESQMALSFQATMAEEESHTRSRSMETSLRMRLDNGIPLTPKLLGYTHDEDGNLVVNEDEAPLVKLAFYMYLYGYTAQQIADAFNEQGFKSYLGNTNWSSSTILQILRNERHCGDVLTRKTYTPDFHTHLSRKNRGERAQSRYLNHHEPIISRDDFIAVQHMISNARYKNKSILPELRVIDQGPLKGFVIVNPRWAGFTDGDYIRASQSVYVDQARSGGDSELTVEVHAGDFDLRGFEVARPELFESTEQARVNIGDRRLEFNTYCVRKFAKTEYAELLINPLTRQLAIRAADKNNRNAICISKPKGGVKYPKQIAATAFYETLCTILQWKPDYRYRVCGALCENGDELAYIFNADDSEAYFKPYLLPTDDEDDRNTSLLTAAHKTVRAIPEKWVKTFGQPFYLWEQSVEALESQDEEDWSLHLEGRLFETGKRLNVTKFDELSRYIKAHLHQEGNQEVDNV